jgi:hypothetical protein
LDFKIHNSNPKSDSARHSQKADFVHNDLYICDELYQHYSLQLNPQTQRLVVSSTVFAAIHSQVLVREIIVVLVVIATAGATTVGVTIFGVTTVVIAVIATVGIVLGNAGTVRISGFRGITTEGIIVVDIGARATESPACSFVTSQLASQFQFILRAVSVT